MPHDQDAGGDPAVLAAKRELRQEAWQSLIDAGGSRFPGARNRIPNFVGAEQAARLLASTPEWQAARTVKANPDSPQLMVRQLALEAGKTLYMAVPRLAADAPFLALRPEELAVKPRAVASIKGSSLHGVPVAVEDLEPVDLVVSGCVAVDRSGARLGKGGGFADLEFAVAHEAGLIDDHTVVATTVHDAQLVEVGRIPLTAHDVGVDLIVTPAEVIRVRRRLPRPTGVIWEDLTDDKIAAIPLLQRLRRP